MSSLVIGTRGSALALAQANWVRRRLIDSDPGLKVDVQVIRTTGDRMSQASLRDAGDTKGLFVKEIEEALLSCKADIAVHSLKDLPTELPEGLSIAAVPTRQDPRDVLVCRLERREMTHWRELPAGARLATGSLRRREQMISLLSKASVVDIRGNVDTRLRKLEKNDLDGLILAAAGLIRLGKEDRISYSFPADEMVPAVGQGALALEIRAEDERTARLAAPLNDPLTAACVAAERAFLALMGGGCREPLGGHARLDESGARFWGFAAGARPVVHCGSRDQLPDLARLAAQELLAVRTGSGGSSPNKRAGSGPAP